MNILTRQVSRDYLRNGKLNIQGNTVSSYGSSGGSLTGNYLPAISNADGTYTVDISKVQFTGNIIAEGEVAAYAGSGSGGNTSSGSVTIYDGLDSEAVDVALSANQGRVLKELVVGQSELSKLKDVTLTNLSDGQILKYDSNKGYWVNGDGTKVTWQNIEGKPEGLTDENIKKLVEFNADDYLLKSVWDNVFDVDANGDLKVKVNVIGEQEISAYGAGISSGTGSITIVDSLQSTAVNAALSANQGRVLKELIDNASNIDLSGYYSKEEINALISQYSKTNHTHTIANITDLQTTLDTRASKSDLNTHTGNTTLHITSTERSGWNDAVANKHTHNNMTVLDSITNDVITNTHTHNNKTVIDGITSTKVSGWNTAYTNTHTHSNKSVLDGITSAKVSGWDGVVTDWNKAFYYDSSGNLRAKVNVIGEKEISAYGAGETTGSGAVTVVDGLTSTSQTAALSANQGRILKSLIDNIDVGDLTGYYNKSEVDSLISKYSKTDHTHSNYVDSGSTQTISGLKTFSDNITLHSGKSIVDENGWGIVGINPTGWTGLPTDGNSIGFGTGADPVYIRTSGNLYHYNKTTDKSYTILDGNNYSTYATPIAHNTDTTKHITATERTNWNTAYTNNHTHSNKTVLDGITSTKVSNWDTVYSNWNKVFTIDSNDNLKVKVNVIGEKEISAYGAGASTGSGSGVDIVDALTSNRTDAALSANQGKVLKGLIDNFDFSGYYNKTELDTKLSNKSDKTHTHTNYVDLTSQQTISGNKTFSTGVTINKSNSIADELGNGIVGINPTGWTGLPSDGTAIGIGTIYSPTYIRTNTDNLYHYNHNKSTAYKILDSNNYTGYSLPLNTTTYNFLTSDNTGVLNLKSNSGTESGLRLYLGDTNLGGLWAGSSNGIYTYDAATGDKLGINGSPYFFDKSANNNAGATYSILHSGNTDSMRSYTVDASGLSTSTFYPVIFRQSTKTLVVRMNSIGGNASVAYNRNDLEFTFRGQGWTDSPQGLTVHFYNCYSAGETAIGCIGMGQEGGDKCVWVRGGLKYTVYSNIAPSLKTSAYYNGNEKFVTGTSLNGGSNSLVTTFWTPQTTSGLGTLYNSGGLALGGGLSVTNDAAIKKTLTVTNLATFNGNFTAPAGTVNTMVASSHQWRNSYYADLSSAGWYRFAVSKRANNAGGTYIFSISRSYYNSNNESYILMANVDYGGCNWTQLGGNAQTQLITKVRCTYTNNSTMYFDLYYSGTVLNTVYVNCLGDAEVQKPTLATSALNVTNETSLTNGFKTGTKSAYPITLYRNNPNGGVYIQYGAMNQLTKTWAAGVDTSHRFAWYYKDTSAGTDIQKMYLDSSGNLNCAGEVTAHSDKRLKDNIKPLEVRGELNPVTYIKDGKESIGFIADEVKEVYPELVVTDESTDEKYLSLNYAQLTAVLYAEIKDLKKEIVELKKKIE